MEGLLVQGQQTWIITPDPPQRSSLERSPICLCLSPAPRGGCRAGGGPALGWGPQPVVGIYQLEGLCTGMKAGEGSEGISDCLAQSTGAA